MILDDMPGFRDKLAAFIMAADELIEEDGNLGIGGIEGLSLAQAELVQKAAVAAQQAQDHWSGH